MLVVHIVGLAILTVGLALFAADQLAGRGRGEAGGSLWKVQFSGPPALVLALIGVLVFLFPFSPWAPTSATGPAEIPESDAIDLPSPDLIYNQDVAEALMRLEQVGLIPAQADIGCSNSTQPGKVRRVTLGPTKDVHILYGKVTDDIDEAAVKDLRSGDAVTVWTPSTYPCQ